MTGCMRLLGSVYPESHSNEGNEGTIKNVRLARNATCMPSAIQSSWPLFSSKFRASIVGW
jgi:hypothetical protein